MGEPWRPGWQGGRFRIKETTADVGIVAEGPGTAQAVASAVAGLYWVISPSPAQDRGRVLRVDGEAPDLALAFARALQRLLVAFDTEGFIGASASVAIRETSTTSTVAIELRGETFDAARHPQGVEIKAVTHHELLVDRENRRVEVLFDV